jgi:uncharacterized protein (DUF849 family)
MDEKCIITAAITGGDVVPSQSPHLPITPQDIADEAVRCAEAGAGVVHIHARDPKNGKPSSDLELFEEIMVSIKDRCDAIICPSTGGNPTMSLEERVRVIPRFKPEMATMNMGTMNYALHFIAESYERRGLTFKYDWELPYLRESKGAIFSNTFSDMEYIAKLMEENEVKPECEIYDLGMIYNISHLLERKLLATPLQIQFVLGVLGGARAALNVLEFFKRIADQEFGDVGYTWSVIGAGYPQEFQLCTLAILMGGNVRVGMEDNLKIGKNVYAKSNAEFVKKIGKIVEDLDREVATPDDARRILGLKGSDKVNF